MAEVRRIGKERAANVSLDSNIGDLGLDSLERMEILAALEERFGGRFPEDVMPELETCRQVLEAAENYLGSGAKRRTPRSGRRSPSPTTASISSRNTSSSKRASTCWTTSG